MTISQPYLNEYSEATGRFNLTSSVVSPACIVAARRVHAAGHHDVTLPRITNAPEESLIADLGP